ncbi:hypothetical protein ACH5RR_039253 [Cinchona calisaya]|uniref:Uncharacterized protein n=1 Tax=Cinchona calisaya TaxID=153742 RepID=A0ABD2Y1S8_9GENT
MEEKVTNHLQSLQGKRESIEDRKFILQKDFDDLEKQNMEVSSTIDREYENIKQMQVEVLRAQDQISSIKSTTFLTNEDARELEEMNNILEASKIAVVDLKFNI